MKFYRYSIDDNILFLKDLAQKRYDTMFDHPYLKVLKGIHDDYGTKIQLNLFYETEDGFTLSQMPTWYQEEWEKNSDWLKLSFHARRGFPPVPPYRGVGYDPVYEDCSLIHKEILRFAGEESISYYTTVHAACTTEEGNRALYDAGIRGLVGIFKKEDNPRDCYAMEFDEYKCIYDCDYFYREDMGMYFFNNHIILNNHAFDALPAEMDAIGDRGFVEIMNHEQHFYEYNAIYQPDFEKKVRYAIEYLVEKGYEPAFLEEVLVANGEAL